jgi:hypothetical protein
MGQEILVDRHFEDGKKLLIQLQKDGFTYAAAGWVKEEATGRWYLYIVADCMDSNGGFAAYSKLNESRRALPDLQIESFDIKLFATKSPVGRGFRSYVVMLSPASLMAHYRIPTLGNAPIDEIFLYPRDMQPAFEDWVKTTPMSLAFQIASQQSQQETLAKP